MYQIAEDATFALFVLSINFILNVFLQELFQTQTLIPMNFVLGVFIISVKTQGYIWGITASLISVLCVNYAFTYPYYEVDLMSPECLSSAFVMLVVAIITGAMTTKLKHQEKLKAESEKERLRANLLRAVSHDLRTPLTSIYGVSSVIIENYDSIKKEQQLKLLENLREDAEWLNNMVENLLSITRIDSENVKVVKKSIPLEELIDSVLMMFQKRYPNQEIQIILPEEFLVIPMDPMLISQVLFNILQNAVKHAKDMTGLILKVEHVGDKAVFSILDNGCGIPQDKLEQIFNGYVDHKISVADGKRNNMGIGLAVCAAIIKAHNSEICAKNREGGGTEFQFSLDLEGENE